MKFRIEIVFIQLHCELFAYTQGVLWGWFSNLEQCGKQNRAKRTRFRSRASLYSTVSCFALSHNRSRVRFEFENCIHLSMKKRPRSLWEQSRRKISTRQRPRTLLTNSKWNKCELWLHVLSFQFIRKIY